MRGFLTFGVYRILGALTGRLPPKVGYWLADSLSSFFYTISPRLRLILEDNIRHVVGPEADDARVEALVRQACAHILKGHYDLFRVERLTAEEVERVVQVDGWDHLREALAQGRGVIVLSAHLGSVDLVIQLPVLRGLGAVSPVLHTEPERLFQYSLRLRQSHGLRLIPTGGPMIELYRALKRGEIVGLAADRDVADSSCVIDFFGTPTRLPDGPVRVALRAGVPLIPAFALRLPDNSFRVQVEPALEWQRTGDTEADVKAGMKLVVAAMERHIGPHPEQWLVAQRIWPEA